MYTSSKVRRSRSTSGFARTRVVNYANQRQTISSEGVVSWPGALWAPLSGRDNYGAFVRENKPCATIARLIGRFRLGNRKFRFSRRRGAPGRAARIRTRPIISLSRIHRGCLEFAKSRAIALRTLAHTVTE